MTSKGTISTVIGDQVEYVGKLPWKVIAKVQQHHNYGWAHLAEPIDLWDQDYCSSDSYWRSGWVEILPYKVFTKQTTCSANPFMVWALRLSLGNRLQKLPVYKPKVCTENSVCGLWNINPGSTMSLHMTLSVHPWRYKSYYPSQCRKFELWIKL